MDFEVESSGSEYIVHNTGGSTVTSAEGNDMRTKFNIFVIVVWVIVLWEALTLFKWALSQMVFEETM